MGKEEGNLRKGKIEVNFLAFLPNRLNSGSLARSRYLLTYVKGTSSYANNKQRRDKLHLIQIYFYTSVIYIDNEYRIFHLFSQICIPNY